MLSAKVAGETLLTTGAIINNCGPGRIIVHRR